MRVSTAVTLALTALLVTSLLGPVAAATPATPFGAESPLVDRSPSGSTLPSGVDSAAAPSLTPSLASTSSPLEPADPKQVIRISIDDDGDARWAFESRFLVTDAEDEATVEAYADDVQSGDRDVGYDAIGIEQTVQTASTATGRDMTVEDAGWNELRFVEPDEELGYADDVRIGVVSYSFTWTEFARVEDNRIRFGDAFQRPDGGTWFPTLADEQRLVVEHPDDYGLETPTELTWDGPHRFEADELRIVFIRTSSSTLGSWWLFAGVGGLVLGAGGYVLYRRLQGAGDIDIPIDRVPFADRIGRAGTGGGRGPDPVDHRDGSAPEPAPDPSVDGGEDGTHVEFDEAVDEDIDLELLSDEERVHRLLRKNGGRMKQANIVTETGWSNAKVSQLLSQMDDDDEIEKLRIGRENLITLPEVDPTEAE